MTQCTTAACSASTHFQVFINYRGPDAKKTFAGHLYRRLSSHGLRIFLDQPELQVGHKAITQIEEAIKVVHVQIAVFSKNYAKSIWCLHELCLMIDSKKRGATILPVFYNVKPEELRWTGADKDGPYAKALRKHEEQQRYEPGRIQRWREALSHAADISGLELEECNGNEAELLDRVVQRVLTLVPKPALHVAKYATGLVEKIKDFEKTVLFHEEQQPLEVKVVGIVGEGGIGKTTLAKEFFNCKRSDYDGCSFLPDVKEQPSRSFLPSLQSKLIKDLKGINKEIERWDVGIGILETYLSSCHALIIIDDVDDIDQLDAFLPIKGVLDPKSLIVITSLDKHVLRSAGIAKPSIYHLKGLNETHSQELFCSHAFFQPQSLPGFENLVARFVNGCEGLPLSLRVFGALLCEKDMSYWEEKSNELQKLPRKILASLKISYDSLNEEEQQIFLDIACFGIGEERDKWVRIWGGSAGLQTLEDRCLVELDSGTTMRMPDRLRDMGREIAEEVAMPRRLWRSTREVDHLFEEQSSSTVIPGIRGIRMPFPRTSEEAKLRSISKIPLNKFSNDRVFRMRELQLLESEGEFVQGILSSVLSPNLKWLCWNNCPCSSVPSWVPMDDLKVLYLKGRALKKLWPCDSPVTPAPLLLRELYVDSPLSEFPKSIEKMKYLEKIVLVNSSNSRPEPVDLSALPEEIFHARSLKYLELAGCFRILPNEFGNLTNLQHLTLHYCDSLQRLPKSLGHLTNLQHINLSRCKSLKKLPKSFGDLTNLQQFVLHGCESLEELPVSLGNLTRLQHIELSGCKRLKKLPDSFGDLTKLQNIELYECNRLKRLPNSLGYLKNLQLINLQGCKNLKELPNCMGDLTNLERMYLHHCQSLDRLPDSFGKLTNLRDFSLIGCLSLKTFPGSFGDLKNLQNINLRDYSFNRLPDSFWHVTNLRSISLTACTSLKILPNNLFGNLTNLQEINLSGCDSLKKLPDSLGNLTKLHRINIYACTSLKELPDSWFGLTNLQSIDLRGCKSLKELPDSLSDLTNLQSIDLGGCKSLKELPDSLCDLTNLQSIDLIGYKSLKKLPDSLGRLTNLQKINLSGVIGMEKLPKSLGKLTNLRSIHLSGCKSLKKLPKSLGRLTNLRSIDISGCKGLKKLPNSLGNLLQLNLLDLSYCCMNLNITLGNITMLKFLDFSGCVQMEVLPAQVVHQKSLEMLNLLGTHITDLTNARTICLSNLKYLYLGSPLLTELPACLGSLSSLEILLLHGCQDLKRLPDSVELLTQLTVLEISKCGIHYLPDLMKMNNLKTLRVRCCPLRELPFNEESTPRRKRKRKPKRREKDKGLIGLTEIELYCTDILDVSFPKGVCIDLQTLCIRCCNNLERIGSLPGTLGHLILRGCGALKKIEGHFGVARSPEVDIRGCDNIQIKEQPHFWNFTPGDTYNPQEVEEEMAALQNGVLPNRFLPGKQFLKQEFWYGMH